MKYKIIIETTKSGYKKYYIKEKWLNLIWLYTSVTDCQNFNIKKEYDTFGSAINAIDELKRQSRERNRSKIVKRSEISLPTGSEKVVWVDNVWQNILLQFKNWYYKS